jgi:hypothetical protein
VLVPGIVPVIANPVPDAFVDPDPDAVVGPGVAAIAFDAIPSVPSSAAITAITPRYMWRCRRRLTMNIFTPSPTQMSSRPFIYQCPGHERNHFGNSRNRIAVSRGAWEVSPQSSTGLSRRPGSPRSGRRSPARPGKRGPAGPGRWCGAPGRRTKRVVSAGSRRASSSTTGSGQTGSSSPARTSTGHLTAPSTPRDRSSRARDCTTTRRPCS